MYNEVGVLLMRTLLLNAWRWLKKRIHEFFVKKWAIHQSLKGKNQFDLSSAVSNSLSNLAWFF